MSVTMAAKLDCAVIPTKDPPSQSTVALPSDTESESCSYLEESDNEDPFSKALTKVIEVQDTVPSFGNVAISNSADVHFGNKTYIHGPVTIKQFITGYKEGDDLTNPAFDDEFVKSNTCDGDSGSLGKRNISDVVVVPEDNGGNQPTYKWPCKGVKYIHSRWGVSPTNMLIVSVLLSVSVTACILFGVLYHSDPQPTSHPATGVQTWHLNEDLVKNVPINTQIDKVLLLSKSLRMVSRLEWLAQPSSAELDKLETPVPFVIITHTATEFCTDQASCTFFIRYIQTFHIESRGWADIAYNFVVGGDGSVYEGRGWDKMGAHTKGYNFKSVGIGFVGTFNTVLPNDRQLMAGKNLIELGVALGKIAPDYKLFGHRQLIPTLSPGDTFFDEIQTWPHFSNETD